MSTHTDRPVGRRRRTWVAATIAAMVATPLALTAGPAAAADGPAAPPAPTLTWQVSEYFHTSFSLKSHTHDGGASEDADGVITFPGGVGSYDPTDDSASVRYQGSVTASLVSGGVEQYHITIADPEVNVEADGSGELTAVVSAASIAQGSNPAASTDPARVVVTTFPAGAADWSDGVGRRTVTATPAWTGVLPADSTEATDLGIGAGKPVDGASFAPTYLAQITPGVRAFFYQSSAGQDTKAPAEFTAEVGPAANVAVTDASPRDGLTVGVAGSGFTPGSGGLSDGVYIGLAPSGGLPDVSSPASMANFAGYNWIPGDAITGGVLAGSLTAPVEKLDPEKSYSLYTWRAHQHTTTNQDTETPVAIDFDQLQWVAPDLKITGPAKAAFGSAPSLTATLSAGATGTVRLTGAGAAQDVTVQNGKATFALPKSLAVGSHRLTVAYAGDASHKPATATATVRVTKAKVKLNAKVKKKATTRKPGKIKVVAKSAVNPTGKVKVTLVKGKAKKTVKAKLNKKGKVVVKLPKLAKGTWKAKVKYTGDAGHKAAAKKIKVKVKKK